MTSTANFDGLRVAAFESRRANDLARLIEKHGGIPHVSPSMRELPLPEDTAAVDFAHRLITGDVELVIFLTGVGFRHLLAAVERHVDRQRFLDALADIHCITKRAGAPVQTAGSAIRTPARDGDLRDRTRAGRAL